MPCHAGPRVDSTLVPSSVDSSSTDKTWMDSLVEFMRETHQFMEKLKETNGSTEMKMSEEERQVKIQEIVSKLAQKEKELSDLKLEQDYLKNYSTNYEGTTTSDPALSIIGVSCSAPFFPPVSSTDRGIPTAFAHPIRPRTVAARPIARSSQGYSRNPAQVTSDVCEDDCDDPYSGSETSGDATQSYDNYRQQNPPLQYSTSVSRRPEYNPSQYGNAVYSTQRITRRSTVPLSFSSDHSPMHNTSGQPPNFDETAQESYYPLD